MGVIAASVPVAVLVFFTVAWWPGLAFASTLACLAAGGLIGATLGRSLAAKPDPLAVLIVAAIADVVGSVIAASILGALAVKTDPIGTMLGLIFFIGLPGYFFLAFPGVVIGIVMARRMMPGQA